MCSLSFCNDGQQRTVLLMNGKSRQAAAAAGAFRGGAVSSPPAAAAQPTNKNGDAATSQSVPNCSFQGPEDSDYHFIGYIQFY